MSPRRLIPILIALLMSVPAAVGWAGKGGLEPSTSWDHDNQVMFQTGDTSNSNTVNQVYLNGYITDGSVVITPESLNSAILGSSITTLSPEPVVIFGVWKDCNGDGYIGAIDGNVGFEYRSELLLGNPNCPAASGPLQHNDGSWVHEFFPINWANMSYLAKHGGIPADNYTIIDSGARVWADKGAPAQVTETPCHLTPQPYGTYRSTGGTLAWADCQDGFEATRVANAVGSVGGIQIGFNDVQPGDNGNSQSVLNQQYPLGDASDSGAVSVMDCSAPVASTPQVDDPAATGLFTNDRIARSRDVYAPGTSPTVDPTASVLGTESQSETEIAQSCGTDTTLQGHYGKTRAGDARCPENMADFVIYFKQPAYACELPYANAAGGRIRPDVEFFSNGPSQRHPYSAPTSGDANPTCNALLSNPNALGPSGCKPTIADTTLNPLVSGPAYNAVNDTENTAFDAPTEAQNLGFMASGAYTSQVWETFDTVQFQFGIDRNFNVAPPQYLTYYAFVSPAAISQYALQAPSSSPHAYGAEACQGQNSGVLNGMNCSPNEWWVDMNGNSVLIPDQNDFHQISGGGRHCDPANDTMSPPSDATCEGAAWGLLDPRTFIGAPYNLRDVDCYDESVAAAQREFGLTPQQMLGNGCN